MLIPLKELCRTHSLNLTGVLHLGANTGQEYKAYKASGITKVIFVEALPHVYNKLVNLHGGHSTCIKACVSDVTGVRRTFHVASNGGESSSLHDFGSHKDNHPNVEFVGEIEVVTTRVDDLGLDLSGVNYLVTDLQGHDLPAIRGCGDLSRFIAIYTEVNFEEVYKGCALIGEVDDYLAQYGFVRSALKYAGNKTWGDALYIKK